MVSKNFLLLKNSFVYWVERVAACEIEKKFAFLKVK